MDQNFQSESAVVLIEDAATNLQQHAVEVTNVVIVVANASHLSIAITVQWEKQASETNAAVLEGAIALSVNYQGGWKCSNFVERSHQP